MDIKVREVTTEEKSSQQIEQELLDKHEQKQEEVSQPETVEEVKEEVEVKEETKDVVEDNEEQLMHCLKAANMGAGVLLNFGTKPEVKLMYL